MVNLSLLTIEDFKVGSVLSIQISEFKNGPYIDGKQKTFLILFFKILIDQFHSV